METQSSPIPIRAIPFGTSPSIENVALSNVESGKSFPDVRRQVGGKYWLIGIVENPGQANKRVADTRGDPPVRPV